MVMMIMEMLKAIEKLSSKIMSWKYLEPSPQSLIESISETPSPATATGDKMALFLVNPRYKTIIPRTIVKINALIRGNLQFKNLQFGLMCQARKYFSNWL
jgi:hypothetical protein